MGVALFQVVRGIMEGFTLSMWYLMETFRGPGMMRDQILRRSSEGRERKRGNVVAGCSVDGGRVAMLMNYRNEMSFLGEG